MKLFSDICITGIALLACTPIAMAQQQPYPSKPLRLIMSFPAGGPTDIVGRLIGQPVSLTTLQPLLLMAHPTLPMKTLKEFIALATAKPGQIN